MTRPRFRMDNTEGYTQAQLDEMNRRFAIAMETNLPYVPDENRKSYEDFVAEQICAQIDTEQATRASLPLNCPEGE
jgi:hypothetical protein